MIDTQKIKDKLSSKERLEKERSKIKEKVLKKYWEKMNETFDRNKLLKRFPSIVFASEQAIDLAISETQLLEKAETQNLLKAKDEEHFKRDFIGRREKFIREIRQAIAKEIFERIEKELNWAEKDFSDYNYFKWQQLKKEFGVEEK